MTKLGIRQRVLLIALAPMAIVALALTLYLLVLRYGDVEEALAQRGAALARQMVPAAEYGMFSGKRAELSRLARTIAQEPDVSAIAFYDGKGDPLAATGHMRNAIDPTLTRDGWSGRSADGQALYFHSKVMRNVKDFDDPFIDSGQGPLPSMQLGSVTVEMSRDRLVERKLEMLVITLIAVSGLMIAVALLAHRLGRSLTEPIMALGNAVHRIREGELSTRVVIHPAETLRDLEEGINAMAAVLEAAQSRSAAALASSEAELRKQYDFAEALLKAQSDAGVGVLILEGRRIVYANDAVETIHGYRRAELLAMEDISHLAAEDDLASIDRLLDRARNGAGERGEITIVQKSGTMVHLEVVVMPMKSEASPAWVVGIELDMTQRRIDAERIAATNAELQRQRDEAERANQSKSRFLAAASHDLRQPLHALNLFGAEMEARVTTSDLHRLSRQINIAIGSMGELLDAMLDVSRLDIAELTPHLQPVALGPLLDVAAQSHRHSAEAKGLILTVRPTRKWVMSDPIYLGRIIGNLIGNAVRYTPSGRIVAGVRNAGKNIRIEVWDTGIGIAQEHLTQVFQEFYQVANQERDSAKGLGLGLSIVERLTNALGHQVEVRSKPGSGSVFIITVPLAAPEPGINEIAAPAQGHFGVRAMVIASPGPERDSLAALLRGWGCYVAEISDERVFQLTLESGTPQLVVCDDSRLVTFLPCLEAVNADFALVVLGAPSGDGADDPLLRPAHRLAKPLRPARLRALLNHLLNDLTR